MLRTPQSLLPLFVALLGFPLLPRLARLRLRQRRRLPFVERRFLTLLGALRLRARTRFLSLFLIARPLGLFAQRLGFCCLSFRFGLASTQIAQLQPAALLILALLGPSFRGGPWRGVHFRQTFFMGIGFFFTRQRFELCFQSLAFRLKLQELGRELVWRSRHSLQQIVLLTSTNLMCLFEVVFLVQQILPSGVFLISQCLFSCARDET